MADVDVLSREQVVIVLVTADAEHPRERVELLAIGPRGRDEFGARILRQRSRQVVGRVPVTETKDGDTMFAIHECSKSSMPGPVLGAGFDHTGQLKTETGNWKLETPKYATIPVVP